MVMKQKFSIVLISFALLLYMLHASIPHHHHHDTICFNIHCLETCDCCNHHHDGACHHHSPDECQIFSSAVVLTDDDKQLEIKILNIEQNDIQSISLIAVDMEASCLKSPPLTAVFNYSSYCPYNKSNFIGHSFPLRAPPAA